MSNTPSDAEIIMLAVESGVSVRTGKGAVKLARAVLAKWGTPQPAPATQQAPQQEAQEPALFVSSKQLAALTDPDDPEGEHGRYLPARKTSQGLFTQPLYTTPQPAPAPLSDDTKRLAWMADEWTPGHEKLYDKHVLETGGVGGLDDLRTFIDKQIAAQEGKT